MLANKSKTYLVISALGMAAFAGVLDYQTGHDVSMLLFYLVPIMQTAWFVGTWAGVAISFACAGAWFYANQLMYGTALPPLTSFWNTSVRLGIFLIVAYIISIQSALRRSLKHEQELSKTDFLTGALNPRAFAEAAVNEISRSSRYGHPFSVAYIDLDDFKMVNDRYGHTTGDLLLQTVVESARKNIRSTDTFARLGGDEFAVLFPETGDEAVAVIVRKLQKELAEKMEEKGWPVTASIGLVTYMKPPESYDEMVRKVDGVMYQAKQCGKNSIIQETLY